MAKYSDPITGILEDPYLNLAAAVIVRAVLDAQAGKLDAREWLLNTGMSWLDKLGAELDPSYLCRYVDSTSVCTQTGGDQRATDIIQTQRPRGVREQHARRAWMVRAIFGEKLE